MKRKSGQVGTHSRKEFKEDQNKVIGEDDEEIRGGILNDPVQEAGHTTDAHKTAIFRGPYDNAKGRDIFSTKTGLAVAM